MTFLSYRQPHELLPALREYLDAGLTRIVIPTVFREDYILVLQALTNDGHTEPYVRMLTRAAQFSWALDYGDQGHLLQQLDRSNRHYRRKTPDIF